MKNLGPISPIEFIYPGKAVAVTALPHCCDLQWSCDLDFLPAFPQAKSIGKLAGSWKLLPFPLVFCPPVVILFILSK